MAIGSRLGRVTAVAGLLLSMGIVTPAAQAADICTHGHSMSTNGWTITHYYHQRSYPWRYKGSVLVHPHRVEEVVIQWAIGYETERIRYVDCAK